MARRLPDRPDLPRVWFRWTGWPVPPSVGPPVAGGLAPHHAIRQQSPSHFHRVIKHHLGGLVAVDLHSPVAVTPFGLSLSDWAE